MRIIKSLLYITSLSVNAVVDKDRSVVIPELKYFHMPKVRL